MKTPEYLTASIPLAETLDLAASVAQRTGQKVGVQVLPTGSSLLFVLDSTELHQMTFDHTICPTTAEQYRISRNGITHSDSPAM
jgi:hypothetical protein